jgi:23S rRNA (uracil1939-C5)-methyltransferase
MSRNKVFEVSIERVNERGYGVGYVADQEIQVLNALPGEVVQTRVFKKKKGVLFGTAEEFIKTSSNRIEPVEDHFTSCSPWQIMEYSYEQEIKKDLVKSLFIEQGITLSADHDIVFPDESDRFGYRNKIEYSFYIDDNEELHFAFFKREGSRGKFPHHGCVLAPEKVNQVAEQFLDFFKQTQCFSSIIEVVNPQIFIRKAHCSCSIVYQR